MLITYRTYLNTQKALQLLVKEHMVSHSTLTILNIPNEDFLTAMKARREALNERANTLKANIEKSREESKKLLRKTTN